MKPFSRLFPLALAAGFLAPPIQAQDPRELQVGDDAPDFTLKATDGKTYSLSKDLKGRWLVLGWFPKAFTGG